MLVYILVKISLASTFPQRRKVNTMKFRWLGVFLAVASIFEASLPAMANQEATPVYNIDVRAPQYCVKYPAPNKGKVISFEVVVDNTASTDGIGVEVQVLYRKHRHSKPVAASVGLTDIGPGQSFSFDAVTTARKWAELDGVRYRYLAFRVSVFDGEYTTTTTRSIRQIWRNIICVPAPPLDQEYPMEG